MAKDIKNNPISIIIPLHNEEENLEELYAELKKVSMELKRPFHLIFVDDGSTDNSFEVLKKIKKEAKHATIIQFRKNYGKTAALQVGFKEITGDIVFTMDADMQDDPHEIPRFIAELEKGYDVVNGYKFPRHDPWTKVWGSMIFNKLFSLISGLDLRDINSGFKAYKAEVIKEISIKGEMHRFVLMFVHHKGYKIKEIKVNHRKRKHGFSKYGFSRIPKGLFDLITTLLITRYSERPLHFFGTGGLFFSFIGFLIMSYLTVIWFMGHYISRRPILFLGILFFIFGMQLISIGLIAEMISNIFHHDRVDYTIKEKIS